MKTSAISKQKNEVQRRTRTTNFKRLQAKTLATDFLLNISLSGNQDIESNANYFDHVISNDYDCLLRLHKIESQPENQSEFLKYYKHKVLSENGKTSRFCTFLHDEFERFESVRLYVEYILSQERKIPKSSEIKIVVNNESNQFNKSSMSDVECDYIKTQTELMNKQPMNSHLGVSNLTLSSNSNTSVHLIGSNKLAHSLTNAIQTISHAKQRLSRRLSRSPTEDSNSQESSHLFTNNLKHKLRKIQRTISESSADSIYTVNMSCNKSMVYNKLHLFNHLKRLNNEKVLLTSNNSPLGIFSRIPFKPNSLREESVNESSYARHRHLSINKSSYSQNSFISDVFELLDLDFEEYLSTGLMSYGSLIDPLYQVNKKKRHMQDDFGTEHGSYEKNEDNSNELHEKEDYFNDSFKTSHKKDMNQHLLTSYRADYLDDPQLTELTAGKNRTCLKFASYAVSIIDYVKPLDYKKEMNETFKEKFPNVQITLTKLRSLKKEMFEIAQETSLDCIIVAQSYIFFEKLILQGLINKSNRKFLAANCLILAAKLNDTTKKDISKLIDTIIGRFRFDSRRELISYEFGILAALEFSLQTKYESDFTCHYERLLIMQENLKECNKQTEQANLAYHKNVSIYHI